MMRRLLLLSRMASARLALLVEVDVRSLAALRIGLALLVLIDLWSRSQDLLALYTDEGVLPRTLWTKRFGIGRGLWSLHMLDGGAAFQSLLFALAALLAVGLLVGYRTRWATVGTWALLFSLQARNPFVNNGGDLLLRTLLFWSMFLPLGAAASLDNRRRAAHPVPQRIPSVATAALLLQIGMPYWMSALLKTHACWTRNYSAIWYALHIDSYATAWGRELLGYPALLSVLTFIVYWSELIGPALAFCPVKTSWFRGLAVCWFGAFHLGLALTMELGLFPYVCLVAWTAFLPSTFWQFLARISGRRRGGQTSRTSPRQEVAPTEHSTGWLASADARWLGRSLILLLLLHMVTWNLRQTDYGRWSTRLSPREAGWIGRMIGLNQRWDMYAPAPPMSDVWFEIRGVLRDGSHVGLMDARGMLLGSEQSGKRAPDHRWRKYLLNIRDPSCIDLHRALADWLCRQWDRSQQRPERRAQAVEITLWRQETPTPGGIPHPPHRIASLCRHYIAE